MIKICKCRKNKLSTCHVGCLKKKARKLIKKIEKPNSTLYQWDAFNCGICKEEFPIQLKIEDRAIDIITINRPRWPCVVIEKVTPKEVGKINISEIAVLKFKKTNESLMGQSPNADLRLMDMTSSVEHARLLYHNNRFLLFDINSRFGTLVQLRKPFELVLNGVAFQIHNVCFFVYIEQKGLVTQMKKRKFKRFEVTMTGTYSKWIKNLRTRMKSIPLKATNESI
jgi:hypothetical protein